MKELNLNIAKLTEINGLLAVFSILKEWTIIALAFCTYNYTQNYFLLFVLIPFIATRQYALYSLLHDCVHFLLFKNKKFNDLVGAIFLASPLFVSLKKMREIHFLHHSFLKEDLDPENLQNSYEEFTFPLPKKKFYKILILDISGINFFKYKLKKGINCQLNLSSLITMLTYLVIFFLLFLNGLFFDVLLLWCIPFITFYQFLNRMRLYFEHNNISCSNAKTRSLILNSYLSVFVSPYGIGFHGEHHFYPNIPNYNLKKLHVLLKEKLKDKVVYNYSIKEVFKHLFTTNE